MKKCRVLALLAFAAAPVVRGANYDCFVYPLTASVGTVMVPQVAAGQAVGYTQFTSGSTTEANALCWSPASPTPINLNPTGFSISTAIGTDGTNQVGSGSGSLTGGANHALLWNGSAGSYVDLNPTTLPGINNSIAISVSGNQQFGRGGNASGYNVHPILWSGTATSAKDLAPTNLATSFQTYDPEATDGTNQVGAGCTNAALNSANGWHALLWSGNASTAVDLTPTNYPLFVNSIALGVRGNQQVGYAFAQRPQDPFNAPYQDAMLWTGTGASAILLNPSGSEGSEALDTNGFQQVGGEFTTSYNGSQSVYTEDAVLWSGTAASNDKLEQLSAWSGDLEFVRGHDDRLRRRCVRNGDR